jgi:hypothetical protein
MLRAGERERADINKRRSVAGHIISKESGTLTFSFLEEKPTDVLGKRFLMYRRFLKVPGELEQDMPSSTR